MQKQKNNNKSGCITFSSKYFANQADNHLYFIYKNIYKIFILFLVLYFYL